MINNQYFNQHKFLIRRIMTAVMFVLWCLVTVIAGYRLLINQVDLPEGFRDYYITFTGIVGVAIGFYYKGRNRIREKIENWKSE